MWTAGLLPPAYLGVVQPLQPSSRMPFTAAHLLASFKNVADADLPAPNLMHIEGCNTCAPQPEHISHRLQSHTLHRCPHDRLQAP